MNFNRMKVLLLAGTAFGLSAAATVDAMAGGLAVREQSAFGQGSSFAGVAAGGSLSSMYWNPATMTQSKGITFEGTVSGIFPDATHSPQAGSTLLALGGAGNSGRIAAVPASYASWQLNQTFWLGLSINSPTGLAVTFPGSWAGRTFAANSSHLTTYNVAPTLAIKINDMVSIGVGAQIQYADATLRSGLGAGAITSTLNGNGWGYGATLGMTLTPWAGTEIGIGWRSRINQDIGGQLTTSVPLPASTPGNVTTTLNLPDVVSLGIRQRLGSQWTVMGTVEWSDWSRIGNAAVNQSSGAAATIAGVPVVVPFGWSDGWYYSVGAEYKYSPALALRAGVAYEESPVTDAVRRPTIPDNNRVWLSAGLSYDVTPKLRLDLAYSHIFIKDPNISNVSGGVTLVENISASVDIVSVGIKYSFYDPPAKTKLWTK